MSPDVVADTISRILVYLGGGATVVFLLSSFLGKVWANRILEQDKLKYKSELEKVKKSYEEELEKYKDQLEREKSRYLRYSEYQFRLYNELWSYLSSLQLSANNLWTSANLNSLIAFIKQLALTTDAVEKTRLLIEEKHYKQLFKIITTFVRFKIGKTALVEIENGVLKGADLRSITDDDIKLTIEDNRQLKKEYDNLLNSLAKEFRKQIT